MWVQQVGRSSEETVDPEAWVNAFLGRIFWDFLGETYWANVVSNKIQMKLSKIRVGTSLYLNILYACHVTTNVSVYQCDHFKQLLLFSGDCISFIFLSPATICSE